MSPVDHNCWQCGHSYKMHMHRTYDLVTVKRSFISVEVQRKIKEKKDVKSRNEAYVDEMNNLVKEFETEQREVLTVSATYASFLKDAAMIPYNDALGDYLDMTIQQEEEKPPLLRDNALINRLYKSKSVYEEEKAVIEDALRNSGSSPGFRFSPEEIQQLQRRVFGMKHFGPSLRSIFHSIDRGNRAGYEQKKIVYNTKGVCSKALEFVNPIKKLVVKSINFVRGSQTSKGKMEKKECLISESFDKLVVGELPDLPETSTKELPNLPETESDDDEFVSFNEMVSADATTKEGSPADEELD